MDDAGPSGILFTFLLLLLFDVVVYGAHAAIQFLKEEEVKKRLEANPKDRRSLLLTKLLDKPTAYVYTVLLFAVVVNVFVGGVYLSRTRALIAYLTAGWRSSFAPAVATVLAFLLLIWLILAFGVILPRKIAAHYPVAWAYGTVDFLYALIVLFKPMTALATATARFVMSLFGLKDDVQETDVTEEEIRSMVTEGFEQGVLQDSEADMITNIFEFSDKQAQDIMTHRSDIVALDGDTTLSGAIHFMLEGNNSRFPVYTDNIDHIVGVLHIRDAMARFFAHDADHLPVGKISGLLRQASFVPETRNIDALFSSMQASQTQMVIVTDEYGQTAGLVSMEDILEEIVGNILDEYDEDEAYIEETSNEDEFIIDGKTPLTELTERFGLSFEDETCETLNGLMISKLDRIPSDDTQFEVEIGAYHFKILSVSNHVIQSVLVTKRAETKPEEQEGA